MNAKAQEALDDLLASVPTTAQEPQPTTKKCRDCASEIPVESRKCPVCLEWQDAKERQRHTQQPVAASPAKGRSAAPGLLVLLLVLLGIGAMIDGADEAPSKTMSGYASQFSSWDGSHPAVVRQVKDAMDDPSSFEHVETKYWDQGAEMQVRMKFRGKNAYGAVVTQTAAATVDQAGNIANLEVF